MTALHPACFKDMSSSKARSQSSVTERCLEWKTLWLRSDQRCHHPSMTTAPSLSLSTAKEHRRASSKHHSKRDLSKRWGMERTWTLTWRRSRTLKREVKEHVANRWVAVSGKVRHSWQIGLARIPFKVSQSAVRHLWRATVQEKNFTLAGIWIFQISAASIQ